jgi:glycine cleavage system H protein
VSGVFATIGITDYAQYQIGEVIAVKLPQRDVQIESDDGFGSLESDWAVFEVVTPVSGEVVDVNEVLQVDPSFVNADPHGEGWMIRVRARDTRELDRLMTSEAYTTYVAFVDA